MAVEKIDNLVSSVGALHSVVDSAVLLIKGISARIQAAVDQALANGATAAELQPLVDLRISVDAKTQELAQAVEAGT